MAIQAIVSVTYAYVPDGASAMSVPSAQSLEINLSPAGPAASSANLTMPSGNTVTLANLTTLNTQIATGLTAALTAAVVAQIAAWPTGGV